MLKIVNSYDAPLHLHKDGKHLLLHPGVNSLSEADRVHFEVKLNSHKGLAYVQVADEAAPEAMQALNDLPEEAPKSKSAKKRKEVLEDLQPLNE